MNRRGLFSILLLPFASCRNWLYPRNDIRHYGAHPDASHEINTRAINMTARDCRVTSAHVILPPGTWRVNGALDFSGVYVKGQ